MEPSLIQILHRSFFRISMFSDIHYPSKRNIFPSFSKIYITKFICNYYAKFLFEITLVCRVVAKTAQNILAHLYSASSNVIILYNHGTAIKTRKLTLVLYYYLYSGDSIWIFILKSFFCSRSCQEYHTLYLVTMFH